MDGTETKEQSLVIESEEEEERQISEPWGEGEGVSTHDTRKRM